MYLRSFLVASLGLLSWSTISASPSLSLEYAGLTDNLSNATVGVLSQLGYDCQTASVGGIICKKCQVEGNKQECQAFICDAVTKKCRERSATIPQVPGLNNQEDSDSNNDIKLPSF
ncbi:MAG: hypothetical protein AAGE84_22105 [Cyanobacteria bacterium P01_G01_bin.39]